MAQVEKTVLVGHSAKRMFNLVDNVEAYPRFLPWCGGVDLHRQDEAVTEATLHIDYHGLKQKFTTENHKVFPTDMEIRLKSGPFKHLEGFWRFTPLAEDACKVQFRLQYEFSSILLEKLIAPVFSHIANTFVEAFVKQAETPDQAP
ncbi:type II toxin-antitoxin system RatA family toxin [Methylobacillus arboreus]|uniref:type II toxin-antitoxin system RatA family toxin n=1 Tax=Methylobacillus arboreus TaxID=755170 RepID=UPI001E510395|nr:type II toxin-antitoxin system RatA family toxin [Methylobacillus arboreus]MCB5191845.1 type II toxin-antitoxin system RatA family toxin [Methylobacillus arboreus]